AQQLAGALAQASKDGSLSITSVSGGTLPPAPTLGGGGVNELLLGSVTGGQVTIPAGSGSVNGYVVVVDTNQPLTIHGGANTTILGGSGPLTIIDPGSITLGDINASTPGAND